MYIIDRIYKTSELYNFEQGCTGEVQEYPIDHKISATSKTGILAKFCEFCGTDDVTIDPCEDDPSRIECSVMEDADGTVASEDQLEAFKLDQCQLWAVTYTAYVQVTEPADMRD